jgi:hypothetical protein
MRKKGDDDDDGLNGRYFERVCGCDRDVDNEPK